MSHWRWDGPTRAGGGRRDKSGRSKEGVAATMAAAGRHRGQRNESGRGEEQVAAMMAAAMLSCGRRAADDVTSQMVGRQTMQQERTVMTMTKATTHTQQSTKSGRGNGDGNGR